jgi:hypothetical protein
MQEEFIAEIYDESKTSYRVEKIFEVMRSYYDSNDSFNLETSNEFQQFFLHSCNRLYKQNMITAEEFGLLMHQSIEKW